MPPPPPPPKGILVAEAEALSTTLKNITTKTAQLYAFFADTRRLGIQHLAPTPPQSLSESLGREVEKYDQICDALESKLLHAIAVLQRDAAREKRRKEQEEAAAAAAQEVKMDDVPLSPRTSLPALDVAMESSPPPSDPTQSPAILGRRPSAISISSLQRPTLPLKLDLSSAALRISPEEASLFSQGLSSPVTLAPKSARPFGPSELPPDILAALASASANPEASTSTRVEIDLTGPDPTPDVSMAGLGNSADKPIDLEAMELDMATMNELFGDGESSSGGGGSTVEGLFTPVISGRDVKIKAEDVEDNFLSALSGGTHDDIFTSLPGDAEVVDVSLPDATASAPLDLESLAAGADAGHVEGAANYADLNLDLFLAEGTHNAEAEMNFDMASLLSMSGDGTAAAPEPEPDTKMEES
uniref:Mediator of RNA polymerase II transcription subunit 4 n=1 Tax=Mycena chlorophos TaxID=658473 RepID=A0ABQ0L4F5_MYCCL|nr:predicted protein [Mycena chlorophos]